MAGLVLDLVGVLDEQAVIYEELAVICERKRAMIIKNDVDGMKAEAGHESELIGKAQRLDRSRDAVAADIARVLNVSPGEITLSLLIDIIKEQPECEDLKRAAARIRAAAETLKTANEGNRVLLESALEYIEYSLNVIRSSGEAVPASYEDDNRPDRDMIKLLDIQQ